MELQIYLTTDTQTVVIHIWEFSGHSLENEQ